MVKSESPEPGSLCPRQPWCPARPCPCSPAPQIEGCILHVRVRSWAAAFAPVAHVGSHRARCPECVCVTSCPACGLRLYVDVCPLTGVTVLSRHSRRLPGLLLLPHGVSSLCCVPVCGGGGSCPLPPGCSLLQGVGLGVLVGAPVCCAPCPVVYLLGRGCATGSPTR